MGLSQQKLLPLPGSPLLSSLTLTIEGVMPPPAPGAVSLPAVLLQSSPCARTRQQAQDEPQSWLSLTCYVATAPFGPQSLHLYKEGLQEVPLISSSRRESNQRPPHLQLWGPHRTDPP